MQPRTARQRQRSASLECAQRPSPSSSSTCWGECGNSVPEGTPSSRTQEWRCQPRIHRRGGTAASRDCLSPRRDTCGPAPLFRMAGAPARAGLPLPSGPTGRAVDGAGASEGEFRRATEALMGLGELDEVLHHCGSASMAEGATRCLCSRSGTPDAPAPSCLRQPGVLGLPQP
jgi:hypothetical protein